MDNLLNCQSNCLGIGIQGFNESSLGENIVRRLDNIVAPDVTFFNYSADIIKLAYANMHPLTFWNRANVVQKAPNAQSAVGDERDVPDEGVKKVPNDQSNIENSNGGDEV